MSWVSTSTVVAARRTWGPLQIGLKVPPLAPSSPNQALYHSLLFLQSPSFLIASLTGYLKVFKDPRLSYMS